MQPWSQPLHLTRLRPWTNLCWSACRPTAAVRRATSRSGRGRRHATRRRRPSWVCARMTGWPRPRCHHHSSAAGSRPPAVR